MKELVKNDLDRDIALDVPIIGWKDGKVVQEQLGRHSKHLLGHVRIIVDGDSQLGDGPVVLLPLPVQLLLLLGQVLQSIGIASHNLICIFCVALSKYNLK